jgi:predicted transcriptional regulator
VKNNEYYTIFAWMHEELGLRNLEEKVYAFIYNFSQARGNEYTGTFKDMAHIIGCSEAGAFKAVKSLTEKGFLVKREIPIPGTGLKRCGYRVNDGHFKEV